MTTFPAEVLRRLSRDLFLALGTPADEAEIVSASLVDANLAGHDSHGVIRVMQYATAIRNGTVKAGVPLTILSRTPAVVAADAGFGLGQVQAHRLLDLLAPMARDLGVAAGTLKNCGHVGRLGEYGERAASLGLALFGTVNNHGSGRAVAPPGGTSGRIGTNPLCLAAPAGAEPVVLDIGTSICAEGKVRVAFNKGEPVPEGWLLDAEGKPTTDPGVMYRDPRGTIRPLGGPQAYKGFGLGLLLDMLAGGLSGAPCSRPDVMPMSLNAVVFVLLAPERFAGREHFEAEVGGLAANVRSCPTVPGAGITLPGDPERRAREARKGGVALDDGTLAQLRELATGLAVTWPA